MLLGSVYIFQFYAVAITCNPQTKKGIINHILTCGGKLKLQDGIRSTKIHITPSSLEKGNVQSLLDMKNRDVVATKELQDSWFTIDLGEQRLVQLAGYFLQSSQLGSYGVPKSWKVEISLDKRDWKLIGKEERKILPNMVIMGKVQSQTMGRYIKFTQIGPNSANNSKFCLNGIELFGSLYTALEEESVVVN